MEQELCYASSVLTDKIHSGQAQPYSPKVYSPMRETDKKKKLQFGVPHR
jgi:hypothetical protein